MSSSRVFFGIIFGALLMGTMLGMAGYLISLYEPTKTSQFIRLEHIEILGLIVGAIFGLIIGGVVGGLTVGMQLGVFRAMLFAFLLNFLVSVVLTFWTGDNPLGNNDQRLIVTFLIVTGIVCGAVVSLLNMGQNSVE